jgi:hypothetical protein
LNIDAVQPAKASCGFSSFAKGSGIIIFFHSIIVIFQDRRALFLMGTLNLTKLRIAINIKIYLTQLTIMLIPNFIQFKACNAWFVLRTVEINVDP